MPIQVGFCCKCCDVVYKPIKGKNVTGHEIVGCKKISKKDWKKGISTEPCWHQSKCPLIGKEGK